ncbi:permease [Spirochaetia bacterium 38H-sp]|uniref:Permease n=1 Tax=Rarispira pelagica TaxID=3141764 RepID=A0ABU9UD22_9SPIR
MADKKMSPNRALAIMTGVFIVAYFVNFESPVIARSIQEAFLMLSEYARQHVILCLVPAMFIAGAITVFLNQQAVIKYLGPDAKKPVAYGVASVSGAILAVCSCTVLPLFKGIYKKGAGLGPAVSFLYSGPAINILAIVLSYKVFGWELGLARMIGAVVFSIVIGLIMHLIFKKDDEQRLKDSAMFSAMDEGEGRSLGQMAIYMFSMVGILVFINWASSSGQSPIWDAIYHSKYYITGFFAVVLIYSLIKWFKSYELKEWVIETRDFSLQIIPYLFAGVLIAGFLLGRPGHDALIPSSWIASLVGTNSLASNILASVSGALMYFATLTEIPILQGLMGAGMAKGPALALLLAGPSLSLPSMLVIGGELGIKKTLVYILLVVILSTLAGWGFGMITS